MSAWRRRGTGAELYLGPIRCAVYQRGRWVTEATWLGRSGAGEQAFWQEWRDTEKQAKAAAIETAARWLRAEIAELQQALAEVAPEGGA